jgi:transposase
MKFVVNGMGRSTGKEATMNVLAHHSIDQLHMLYRTELEARMARRIQGIWLARRGRTCREIMEIIRASRRTVQVWVAKYNTGGIEELLDRPRSGAPTKLPAEVEKELRRRIEAGPTEADGVSVFAAPAIRDLVEREYGVVYSLAGLCDWLHRMGFSYLPPRPRHEQSDLQAQEDFKKSSRPGWARSSDAIATSG